MFDMFEVFDVCVCCTVTDGLLGNVVSIRAGKHRREQEFSG